MPRSMSSKWPWGLWAGRTCLTIASFSTTGVKGNKPGHVCDKCNSSLLQKTENVLTYFWFLLKKANRRTMLVLCQSRYELVLAWSSINPAGGKVTNKAAWLSLTLTNVEWILNGNVPLLAFISYVLNFRVIKPTVLPVFYFMHWIWKILLS